MSFGEAAVLEEQVYALLGVGVRIRSNRPELVLPQTYLSRDQIHSQLTNTRPLQVDPEAPVAGTFTVLEAAESGLRLDGQDLEVSGPFLRWEAEAHDRRETLFGNIGLFFKFLMARLEEARGILSFHASSLYDPRTGHLVLVGGFPGAGKTAVLMSGLEAGFRLVSTEMTHVEETPGGWTVHKGAMIDNVRLGTLVDDFPSIARRLGLELDGGPGAWARKAALDLSPWELAEETLADPPTVLVLPRIEAGRAEPWHGPLRSEQAVAYALYLSAAEKIAGSNLLYGRFASPGLDTPELAQRRAERVCRLVESGLVRQAHHVLAAPRASLAGYQAYLTTGYPVVARSDA